MLRFWLFFIVGIVLMGCGQKKALYIASPEQLAALEARQARIAAKKQASTMQQATVIKEESQMIQSNNENHVNDE